MFWSSLTHSSLRQRFDTSHCRCDVSGSGACSLEREVRSLFFFAVAVDFWAHGGMHTAVRNLGIAEAIFVINQKFWFVGPNAARQHAVLSRTLALKGNWPGNSVDWRSCHSLAPTSRKFEGTFEPVTQLAEFFSRFHRYFFCKLFQYI